MARKPTRENILDAAERIFAERGGEANVTMRDLASEAEVRLSLLSYHFGGKADLYRAVFARRANQLADSRVDALVEALTNPDHSLEAVVTAFIRPSVQMRFSDNVQGSAFALLTAIEAVDAREAERGILTEHFDPTARRFISALATFFPEAPYPAVVEAYLFMVGALVTTMVSGSRLARLSATTDGPQDAGPETEAMIDHLVAFCAGGVRALLSTSS